MKTKLDKQVLWKRFIFFPVRFMEE